MMVCLIFLIIGSASSSGMDPCTALCQRDGPAICTGGSWNKNGICHAYLFRGDPARGDYCYHTGLTATTCPSSGTPVRIADAVRLLGGSAPSQDTVVPARTTTTTTAIARTSTRPEQAVVPPRPTGGVPILPNDSRLWLILSRNFLKRRKKWPKTTASFLPPSS